MKTTLWNHIQKVKEQSPLVHNITNYVVMNSTANALLAVGASPIMAHAPNEVNAMVAISHALVVNIGTLDDFWLASMLQAAEQANLSGKPWVLDPVGAGATDYRDTALQQLLQFKPTVIRGNASEIIALAQKNTTQTKGVDSTASSLDAVEAAQLLVAQFDTVVCISGATDIIVTKNETYFLDNGHAMMTKVTGLGCTATALIGAFIGVVENKTEATLAAMSLLAIAGQLGAVEVRGPGSLQVRILDYLYSLEEVTFYELLKIKKA